MGSTPPLMRQIRNNEKQTEQLKQKMTEIQENAISVETQNLKSSSRDNLNSFNEKMKKHTGALGVLTSASSTARLNPPTLDHIDSTQARNFINNADKNGSDHALCSNTKCIVIMVILSMILLPWIYFTVWKEEQEHLTLAEGVQEQNIIGHQVSHHRTLNNNNSNNFHLDTSSAHQILTRTSRSLARWVKKFKQR